MDTLRGTVRTYVYLVGFLLTSFLFLKFALPYVLPFVLGLFLAALIDPAVTRLKWRWRIPRPVGAAMVIFLLVAGVAFFTVVGAIRLGAELVALSESLPSVYQALYALASALADMVGQFSATLPPALKSSLDQQLVIGYRLAQAAVGDLLSLVQGWLAGLPGALMVILITALATYFFSTDKEPIRDFLIGLLPRQVRPGAIEIKARLMASTIGLVKAQAILVFLTFVVILIGLNLLGTRYALTVALVSALLDVIPILGPSLVFVPWAAYLFLVGQTGPALGLLLLYGVVAVVRGAAQVYVIGDRIGLHPLATLFALYLGIQVFGAVGFIFGPLVAIVLKAAVEAGLLPGGPGPRAGDRA